MCMYLGPSKIAHIDYYPTGLKYRAQEIVRKKLVTSV